MDNYGEMLIYQSEDDLIKDRCNFFCWLSCEIVAQRAVSYLDNKHFKGIHQKRL